MRPVAVTLDSFLMTPWLKRSYRTDVWGHMRKVGRSFRYSWCEEESSALDIKAFLQYKMVQLMLLFRHYFIYNVFAQCYQRWHTAWCRMENKKKMHVLKIGSLINVLILYINKPQGHWLMWQVMKGKNVARHFRGLMVWVLKFPRTVMFDLKVVENSFSIWGLSIHNITLILSKHSHQHKFQLQVAVVTRDGYYVQEKVVSKKELEKEGISDVHQGVGQKHDFK